MIGMSEHAVAITSARKKPEFLQMVRKAWGSWAEYILYMMMSQDKHSRTHNRRIQNVPSVPCDSSDSHRCSSELVSIHRSMPAPSYSGGHLEVKVLVEIS